MEKIKKFAKRNTAALITVGFAVISFLLWVCSSGEKVLSDLWLNLLAGFVASICTFTVVDNVLKKQKENERIPLKLALYRDVQLFASRIIGLWGDMYEQCIELQEDLSADSLFTPENIEKVFESLDLDGEPNITPQTDWFSHIYFSAQEMCNRGNGIIDRYINESDSRLIQAIHHTVNDSSFVGMLDLIRRIRSHDIQNKFPRIPILLCYTASPTERDFQQINLLFEWCRSQYKELHEHGEIYPIAEIAARANNKPKSIIMQEKIDELQAQIDVIQNKNTTIFPADSE